MDNSRRLCVSTAEERDAETLPEQLGCYGCLIQHFAIRRASCSGPTDAKVP